MARIRKGDLVLVRAGDDAGRTARVLRVIPKSGRAVVEGVNVVFKHLRKSQKNPKGGRVEREVPLPLSNLMPVDPSTGEGVRVSWRTEGGVKRRYARGSDRPLDAEAKGRSKKAKA
jgi:large subunit ribosomal protein L24